MILVFTRCPICQQETSVAADEGGYRKFEEGTDIREALPNLSEPQREQLVSGICGMCWSNMLPDD